jgi:hypothetical protein
MLIHCIASTEQTAVSYELAELFCSQGLLTFWMTENQVVHLKGTENILLFPFSLSFDKILVLCLSINNTFQLCHINKL